MKKRILFVLLLIAALTSPKVHAATYTVDRLGDLRTDGLGNTGTLRYVTGLLNGSSDAANTINFTTSGTITLTSLLPEIVRPVNMTTSSGPVQIIRVSAPASSYVLSSTVPIHLPDTLMLNLTGSSLARGLYSSGNLTLEGPFNSSIDVSTTSGYSSHGIRSSGNLNVDGNLGGTIHATSAADNAFGLSALTSGRNITIDGDITGTITTDASTFNSFGFNTGNGSITVTGGLSPGSSITATAGTRDAGVMYANYGGISIYGDLGGEHAAYAQNYARTFYAYNADSSTNGAFHLYGAVTGRVIASATETNAYGLVSRYSDVIIDRGVAASGIIRTEATTDFSYALYAYYGNLIINSDVEGDVTAIANRNVAVALGGENISIDGAISGTIYATASGSGAYGLNNNDPPAGLGISISNGIAATGSIIATAGGHTASGLSGGTTGIYGANSTLPLAIAGSVSAEASGAAAGVLSIGPMNLSITGTVSGVDRSGQDRGYSIRSGGFDLIGGFTRSVASDDLITLAQTGSLLGNVDLGAGNDTMTMSGTSQVTGTLNFGAGDDILHLRDTPRVTGDITFGAGNDSMSLENRPDIPVNVRFGEGNDTLQLIGNADVSSALVLDGGSGGETTGDRIVLSDWQGQITELFQGWERVEVVNASTAVLDLDDLLLLAPSAGQQLTVMIENGSTVLATGVARGRYVVEGNLTNGGLLELRDGVANDRVVVTNTYTGTGGRVGLDVALGAGSQSDPELLDLLVVGSAGTTTGTAGGRTSLLVPNISRDGAIRLTDGKGILVVQVNGESTSDAFFLDSSNDFRDAQVQLLQGGGDGSGGESWYLVITRGSSPFSHRVIRLIEPMVMRLGEESIPRFHERQAYGWSVPGTEKEPASWWTRTTGSRFLGGFDSEGETVHASGYSSTMQVGSDLGACWQGNLGYRSGVYAGTGYLQVDSRVLGGVKAGSVELFGISVGGYASVECRDHWYLEGVVQASRYDIDASFSSAAAGSNGKLWGYIASAEGGFRYNVSPEFYVEPQAQLMVQYIDGYGMETPAGIVRQDCMTGVLGRLGMTGTIKPDGWRFSPFFEVNALKEFGDYSPVTYDESAQSYQVETDRLRLGGAIGISSRSAKPDAIEYYLKVGAMAGVNGHDSRDYVLTVGLRKSW
jgi:hypothetical protein